MTTARTLHITSATDCPTNPADESLARQYVESVISEVFDNLNAGKAEDSAVVHDTGDETIAGVKTFSSSPIAPTPTVSAQIATKGYVDAQALSVSVPDNSLTEIKMDASYKKQAGGVAPYDTMDARINAYTLTTNVGNAYTTIGTVTGTVVPIKFNADSTGAVTINGKNLLNSFNEPVTEIKAGVVYSITTDGTSFFVSSSGLSEFFGDGSDGTLDINLPAGLSSVTTAQNGGTVSQLFDMNASTVFTTGSLGAGADVEVFKIDFGQQILISNIKFWQIKTSAARNFVLQTSDDGTNWTTKSTSSLTTSYQDIPINYSLFSARFLRLVTAAGTAGTVSIQGVTINYNSTDLQTTFVYRHLLQSTLNGDAVIKNYTSINVSMPATGYEITVTDPCQGLILYCQGDSTINANINMSKKGSSYRSGIVPIIMTNSIKTVDGISKFNKLSTTLKLLRGGNGGNGGKGAGTYAGNGGTGSIGRINLGGFGGGGGGGAQTLSSSRGQNGGSPIEENGYADTTYISALSNTNTKIGAPQGGQGGCGSMTAGNLNNVIYFTTGKCLGSGQGGQGEFYVTGQPMGQEASNSITTDSEYSGGLFALISGGNVIIGAGFVISANGGNGIAGTAQSGVTTGGGGGGGGGAGGGVIIILFRVTYINNGTIQVNGGAGGIGGASSGGVSAGSSGTSGSTGSIYTQQV